MAKRPRPTPQRALPGLTVPPRPRDEGLVTIPMQAIGKGTADAWFLKPDGPGKPTWAPRKLVTRGEGLQASLFTMPKWVAVERGWLK